MLDVHSLPDRIVFHLKDRKRARPFMRALLGAFGIDIPPTVVIGERLRLAHAAPGLVLHDSTVLGNDVILYQGVTVGRADVHVPPAHVRPGGGVVIADEAVLCANATVLFRSGETITIGHRAVVGAGAVLTRSVPDGEIWAGNPARRISQRQ